MILDAFALPGDEEAKYLLAGVARLIELRGADAFVSAPLLLAKPEFFPDPVEPRARGVAVLIRRLLTYANLQPRRLDVDITDGGPTGPVVMESHEKDAAAWFLNVDDGVYHFGVRDSELRDERGLIGILGHEVAHAYRAHHHWVVRDRDLEEELTDLTTVYLGFGAFRLESSFQFKTGHYDASGQKLLYERRARGYLLPGQLAYLLAAQLVVRSSREDLLDQVLRSLSANHSATVKRAFKDLSNDEQGLLEALRLPPEEEWPPPKPLQDALLPLPPVQIGLSDTGEAPDGTRTP